MRDISGASVQLTGADEVFRGDSPWCVHRMSLASRFVQIGRPPDTKKVCLRACFFPTFRVDHFASFSARPIVILCSHLYLFYFLFYFIFPPVIRGVVRRNLQPRSPISSTCVPTISRVSIFARRRPNDRREMLYMYIHIEKCSDQPRFHRCVASTRRALMGGSGGRQNIFIGPSRMLDARE